MDEELQELIESLEFQAAERAILAELAVTPAVRRENTEAAASLLQTAERLKQQREPSPRATHLDRRQNTRRIGRRWTHRDDAELRDAIIAGYSIVWMCAQLQRSEHAIKTRARVLQLSIARDRTKHGKRNSKRPAFSADGPATA